MLILGVFVPLEIFFTHMDTAGKRHSFSHLSSEGSSECHMKSSPRIRNIQTCCRAFGSGTVNILVF